MSGNRHSSSPSGPVPRRTSRWSYWRCCCSSSNWPAPTRPYRTHCPYSSRWCLTPTRRPLISSHWPRWVPSDSRLACWRACCRCAWAENLCWCSRAWPWCCRPSWWRLRTVTVTQLPSRGPCAASCCTCSAVPSACLCSRGRWYVNCYPRPSGLSVAACWCRTLTWSCSPFSRRFLTWWQLFQCHTCFSCSASCPCRWPYTCILSCPRRWARASEK